MLYIPYYCVFFNKMLKNICVKCIITVNILTTRTVTIIAYFDYSEGQAQKGPFRGFMHKFTPYFEIDFGVSLHSM